MKEISREQKLRALQELANNLSHKFSNLLQVISGHTEYLAEISKSNKSAAGHLKQITLATLDAKMIILKLLAFSGKQRIFLKTEDLNKIINDLGSEMEIIFKNNVKIDIKTTADPTYVRVDKFKLKEAFLNIITNAAEAMPKGGNFSITISPANFTLCSIAATHPKDFVKISFSDNGIGMEPQIVNKISEPFFTTKGFSCGTGHGMSIAYGIIDQHKGFLDVTSKIGKGTTIDVYLPLSEPPEITNQKNNIVSVENFPLPSGEAKTVLLAEDNSEVMDFFVSVLKIGGYNILKAKDGDQAVEMYLKNKDKIAAVILDIIMPKKSGTQVLRELQEISPEIKFLFLSGYTEEEDNTFLKEHGIKESNFLFKPVTKQTLLSSLDNVLKKD